MTYDNNDDLDEFSTYETPQAINAEELKKQVNSFKQHLDHSQDPLNKMNQKTSEDLLHRNQSEGQLHISHGGVDENLTIGNEWS